MKKKSSKYIALLNKSDIERLVDIKRLMIQILTDWPDDQEKPRSDYILTLDKIEEQSKDQGWDG